ncbi:MAG TPA: hypothetical protein VJ044_17535 [Candidatus Hodarchaeales archaeon]|nr:hypothetical protein [Candidatus Hodarchaeales archaeon]
MTDNYVGLFDGPVDERAYVVNAIADEQITIGSPVILVAPAPGDRLPRVEPNDTQGGNFYGICVGGSRNGTYGGVSEVAGEAGEAVKICVNGRCKARVKGDVTPIVINSPLTLAGSDGIAEVALASDNVSARAQQPATGASDFIVVFVDQEGVL